MGKSKFYRLVLDIQLDDEQFNELHSATEATIHNDILMVKEDLNIAVEVLNFELDVLE